jgi:hypothetical protein
MYQWVWRLACLEDLERHAGGNVATGGVSLAERVLGGEARQREITRELCCGELLTHVKPRVAKRKQ